MTTHENTLTEPLSWGKGSYIFVCSMSDLFHEKAPFKFIDRIMETINQSKRHTYQILTKRAARMAEYFAINPVPSNAWIGVTVECRKTIARIDSLREIDASKRFISFEPLIEDVGQLDLHGIDWVIVGGETGNKARPTQPDWVRSIRVQSEQLNIPFFFKQWGTWGPDGIRRSKKANGGELDGEIVRMFPSHLHKARVQ
jgi:protein gp37